ncbi:integrase catalytic domain-containing protein [Trichonephila inaurata madagascariensis]|uniref:Integrase catalytic domain-containing protein n=1 Tax=Trichonephila inaurata madagascariensis TaxID=2747483 RepID=A0A8X6MLM0_9ARAC|nr:integrase catalytic domain-containing protein [Trichonephila inaurata madagascariensis]
MFLNLDSTTEMDYQNATLPKSGNSTPERPIGPTSCARLEDNKADICRYTLIAQGFENMITILRQSNAQDEHDPTYVEMVKQRTIYEDLLEKAVSEFGTLPYCDSPGSLVHVCETPTSSPVNSQPTKRKDEDTFISPTPPGKVSKPNLSYKEKFKINLENRIAQFYNDYYDIIGRQPFVNQALTITLEATKVFEDASISLHKWQTISKSLHNAWQDKGVISDENPHFETFEKDNLPYKDLGIARNSRDLLYFDLKGLIDFVSKIIDTKRFILQVLGRIFDPIGVWGHFTLRIKHLIQKVWLLGVDWDVSLPDDIISLWADKYLAKPIEELTSPLPSDRINQTPAFLVCGLDFADFAGPLYVNNFGEQPKSYISLFTCGVTRALHL